MEFLFDTAHIPEIKDYIQIYPFNGVTSNPTILRAEGRVDFFDHFRQIRELIGPDKSLHIQVLSPDYKGMMAEARLIREALDDQVYIKIPVNEPGLQAMHRLKADGANITATAIYTKIQGMLAIQANADYIAPYCNRMQNMDIDPWEVIEQLSQAIDVYGYPTKILAASFKNIGQVTAAFKHGAHAVTLPPTMLRSALAMPAIQKAVDDFAADWEHVYGQGTTITDLPK